MIMPTQKELDKLLNELRESKERAIANVRSYLLSIPYNQMIEEIKVMDSEELEMLCDVNRPQHEDYEICQAVAEVLKNRAGS